MSIIKVRNLCKNYKYNVKEENKGFFYKSLKKYESNNFFGFGN